MKNKNHLQRLCIRTLLALALLSIMSDGRAKAITTDEAAKFLPEKIDVFHARGPAQLPTTGMFEQIKPEDFGAVSYASRTYTDPAKNEFIIELVQTNSESGAYALLTYLRPPTGNIKLGDI